jgi:DNA-directed RNA polymerase subunit RPC12/RpoP
MIENQLSNNEKMKRMVEELNHLFDIFNHHFYNDVVKAPIILIQTTAREHAKGWCTTRKIWKDNENNEYYYEITMSAEYIYEGIYDICDTLLHEMAHLYDSQNDIKDTSRGTTYHNEKFKKTAEKSGLIVEHDKTYGWAMTSLKNETKQFIDSLKLNDVFVLTRQNHKTTTEIETKDDDEKDETEPKKKSSRRYVCPECHTIVRASKEVNIVCGDCGVEFEEKERSDNDE